MKRSFALALVIVAIVCFVALRLQNSATSVSRVTSVPAPVSHVVSNSSSSVQTGNKIPTAEDWAKMSEDDRLRTLENLGYVPAYARMPWDWYLAQKTSWWGKPLDPQEFWKNRAVWWDKTADAAARNRGRMFPPMPHKDASLPKYHDESDILPSIDGIQFHGTSEESAFWTKFYETQPHPPEDLERQQLETARKILEPQWDLDHGGRISSRIVADLHRMATQGALDNGYPPEAFSDDALFASYVLQQSQQYQGVAQQGNSTILNNFLNRLVVDPTYVTNGVTDQQVQAANAWKIPYLQRLQSQNTDSSYINAYLQAWNLPASALSGGAKHP